ncbi:MAG: hypothetical protein JWR09_3997 [Mucilaginibacter sp.]|nr:hypothetical protein [Mucilaginibacter sp.]
MNLSASIKMKNILSILLTCSLFAANAQSPVSISKKVVTLPKSFEKPNEHTSIYNSEQKTGLPWIVFSDRAENYTYTSPGGTLIMKKLNFMDPFYVSEEKNGFIKLIKYQPGMVQGKKLTNKKAAQSYGWISKSKVLPWQSAFVSTTGFPSKYIAIINGKNPMLMPDFYYDKTDSAYVYTSPDLNKKKTKVALDEVVYAYKKSDDGKKFLIGSDAQLVADSAAHSVYGWIAADALHSWGDRLYIGSAKNANPKSDDSVAAYINQSMHATGPVSPYFVFDPLLAPDEPLLRSIPVSPSANGNVTLSLATDVYDKKNNSILNIKGGHLQYKDYLDIRNNIHHINVVFVVDGGSSMHNYFSGLTSTIQSFEGIFNAHAKGNQLNYGAVVYRNSDCPPGGVQNMPFAADYRTLVKFLEKQSALTASCTAAVNNQPVFDGIRGALRMFKGHTNETNLVVLIGSTGAADSTEYTTKQVANEVAAADARILAIQVFSDYNSIYNDFVIQARQIVSQSAVQLANQKKQRKDTGEGLTNTQSFNTSLSDSVSFYLDYPKNSLIQGAVVFPPKGVVKSNQSMRLSVERLMSETDHDIHSEVRVLDSAFRLTGRENRYVQPMVTAQVSPAPDELGNNMPHNAFKYYFTAEAAATIVSQSQSQLQYLLILNEQEYKQLMDLLSLMIGENLQQDASNYRSKLFHNYLDIIRKRLNLKMSRGDIKDMLLSNYFQKVTGLPLPGDKDFFKNKVVDLKRPGDMSQAQFEAYISFLIHSSETIKQSALISQHFISNGKIYYYVTQANLK